MIKLAHEEDIKANIIQITKYEEGIDKGEAISNITNTDEDNKPTKEEEIRKKTA